MLCNYVWVNVLVVDCTALVTSQSLLDRLCRESGTLPGFLPYIPHLWMFLYLLHMLLNSWHIDDDDALLIESSEAWHKGINDLLIDGPDFVPFHHVDWARWALSNDKLLQSGDCHTTAKHASHRRQTGVVPGNSKNKIWNNVYNSNVSNVILIWKKLFYVINIYPNPV